MTVISKGSPAGAARSPLVWVMVLPAVPILNLGYQFCAEQVAKATLGLPFGLGWLRAVVFQSWTLGLVVLEVGSFAVWMIVLSRVSMSVAFPLTAVSYALVVALGWFVFHEPIQVLQIVGAIAITTGVFMIGAKPGAV